MGSPESTIDHASQAGPHMIPLESTKNAHLIEETPAATAPQEEPAGPSEQHVEQRQTCSSRVVCNTYSEGLEQ